MPRDLPIGNGQLLVTFDADHQIRDIYYPYVGKENHAGGHPFRFGIRVGSTFCWITRQHGWHIHNVYEADTLVTQVQARHEGLGVQLIIRDCVDFHETVLLRQVEVRNETPQAQQVRLFFHQDFRIYESEIGDTAAYDPRNRTVVHYKGERYFLVNVSVEGRAGVTHYAIGQKGSPGHEGTWRDAEDDGQLSGNPIAQGAVDSVVAAHTLIPAGQTRTIYYWMVAAQTWAGRWDGAQEVNAKIVQRGPASFIERTRAYWRLWVRKEPLDFADLPDSIVDLYRRSLLILRTQIDNRGAILAANDSDVTQFNRDTYSYLWPRDGALVAHALDLCGYPDISLRFFHFCADVLTQDGYLLHKYNPDKSLASSWHPWVEGDQPQLPIQEDETALVVWALWKHFQRYRDLEAIKPLYGRLVRKAAEFMARYREPHTHLPAPSYDLWEERRGILSFTCASVYAGLRAAAEFARSFGEVEAAQRYESAAAEIRDGMDAYLWRPELGRFARMINVLPDGSIQVDPVLDASLWGLFYFSAYRPDDPRIVATLRAVREQLWCKTPVGGIARYTSDSYHQVSRDVEVVPGNPWFICTLWYADYLIATARNPDELRGALDILVWVDQHKLPSGVLAEQVHPYTNAPLSVAPLTWSHATYVATVQAYLERLEQFAEASTPREVAYRKLRSHELSGFGHVHAVPHPPNGKQK
ncbi:MAG: glycoside hydrolase family 15 protein [Myxococcota bacterium]|nr:glycoside hydrolase family 15 protein [Myxococcota bacterium]